MEIIAWLMLGSGVFLLWAVLTRRDPIATARGLLTGEPIPPGSAVGTTPAPPVGE